MDHFFAIAGAHALGPLFLAAFAGVGVAIRRYFPDGIIKRLLLLKLIGPEDQPPYGPSLVTVFRRRLLRSVGLGSADAKPQALLQSEQGQERHR